MAQAERYRKVLPKLWNDEKFVCLDPDQKLVCLNIFTSPQSNRIGLFVYSPGLASEDTGLDSDRFMKAFKRVCEVMGFKWDAKLRVLYIPSWWKYNGPDNPNVMIGNLKDLRDLPKSHLVEEFRSNLEHLDKGFHDLFRECVQSHIGSPRQQLLIPVEEPESEDEQEEKHRTPQASTLLDIYNEENEHLPKVQKFTKDRQAKCKARLRAAKRAGGLEKYLEDFRLAVRKAQNTPFLLGHTERGWTADFDWFIGNETNIYKVLEGKYDDNVKKFRPRDPEAELGRSPEKSEEFSQDELNAMREVLDEVDRRLQGFPGSLRERTERRIQLVREVCRERGVPYHGGLATQAYLLRSAV